MDRTLPQPLEIWHHFSGNDYLILVIAMNCTNGGDHQSYVVYKRIDLDNIYMRRIDEFMSEVDHEKYPDVKQKYRFVKRE